MKPYGKHWLVCTGTLDWPEKIEKEAHSLANALNTRAETLPYRVIINACTKESMDIVSKEDPNPSVVEHEPPLDILLLPEQILLPQVSIPRVSSLIDAIQLDAPLSVETWSPVHLHKQFSHIILICGHKRRDKRCGEMGPLLHEAFHRSLTEAGVVERVAVYQTSHFGGTSSYRAISSV